MRTKKYVSELKQKNQLEQLCYQYRQTLNEEKLKDKFTDDEKRLINDKADEALKWSNDHPSAGKDEYEDKIKDLESIFNPIMQRVYQQSGGEGMPRNEGGRSQGTSASGATTNVDDVD